VSRVPEYPHHEDRDVPYPSRTGAEVCLLELRTSLLRVHGQAVAGEREKGREEIKMNKKAAQREAANLRRSLKKVHGDKLTVNVKEITPGNWGVRFSPKGTRDKFKVER